MLRNRGGKRFEKIFFLFNWSFFRKIETLLLICKNRSKMVKILVDFPVKVKNRRRIEENGEKSVKYVT